MYGEERERKREERREREREIERERERKIYFSVSRASGRASVIA